MARGKASRAMATTHSEYASYRGRGEAEGLMASNMQVSVESLEGLQRKITVEVPATRIDAAVSERLKSLSKTVRMDGFRPGKVPLKVVQQRFGTQVRQEVLGDVIQSSFREAVVEEQLNPAGMPQIEPLPQAGEATFRYSATFEVYPEVALGPLAELEIERAQAQVGDGDVDTMLESLRKQRTEWSPVERAAQNGDRLLIDFAGFADGEPLENANAERYHLELGAGQLIPGFEDQLLGARAGEERQIDVQFPDDYRPQDLAGKAARFTVKVHAVEAPTLPELDQAFAASFGVSEGGVAALRDKVRANMERELRQALRTRLKVQVMDALLAANELLLPEALVREEVARLQRQHSQGAGTPPADEPFLEEARRRVKLGLLIAEIVKANDLKAEPDRVRDTIEELAAPYEDPGQVVNYYYGNKELLSSVEAMVLEDQVVDWVLGQARVTEVEQPFEQIMKPQPPAAAGDDT